MNINVHVLNNRASKIMRQKLTKLSRNINKAAIGNFNTPFSAIDRTRQTQ